MDKKIIFGVAGLSGRGSSMIKTLLLIENVEIAAVCDKYTDRVERMVNEVEKITGKKPQGYTDYREMNSRDDIDVVMISTTWITHSRIAIDAMKKGKHAAVEVGGAASVEECWQLVRTSEETGKNCMLLENCCYGRNEMAIFNMSRLGLFGEIVHCQGGYEHDIREEICKGREIRHGRIHNFMHRNGEVYPTHQLGPIAKLLNINRGNRFLTVNSVTSKSAGLNVWLKDNMPEGYDLNDYAFAQGDITTTIIKCAHGETIVLTHDCSLPRPYSRNYKVHGTKGVYCEDNNSIYFDDLSEEKHEWEPMNKYIDKYDHPLWQEYKNSPIESGHDGMDYLVLDSLVSSLKNNQRTAIDVYDTAAWMAITCLSEQSAAMGGAPVPVPDFTNGMWIDREPVERGRYCLEEVCSEYFIGV